MKTVVMPEKLTEEMIEAVYDSDIMCIRNHDVDLNDLTTIYEILVEIGSIK